MATSPRPYNRIPSRFGIDADLETRANIAGVQICSEKGSAVAGKNPHWRHKGTIENRILWNQGHRGGQEDWKCNDPIERKDITMVKRRYPREFNRLNQIVDECNVNGGGSAAEKAERVVESVRTGRCHLENEDDQVIREALGLGFDVIPEEPDWKELVKTTKKARTTRRLFEAYQGAADAAQTKIEKDKRDAKYKAINPDYVPY